MLFFQFYFPMRNKQIVQQIDLEYSKPWCVYTSFKFFSLKNSFCMNSIDAIKLISWSNKDNAATNITHYAYMMFTTMFIFFFY